MSEKIDPFMDEEFEEEGIELLLDNLFSLTYVATSIIAPKKVNKIKVTKRDNSIIFVYVEKNKKTIIFESKYENNSLYFKKDRKIVKRFRNLNFSESKSEIFIFIKSIISGFMNKLEEEKDV